MKKVYKGLLAFTLAFTMVACGKSETKKSEESRVANNVVDKNGMIISYEEDKGNDENQRKFLNGLVDKSGKTIVKPIYQELQLLCGEYYAMQLDGKSGIINAKGEVVEKASHTGVYFDKVGDAIIISDEGSFTQYSSSLKKGKTMKGTYIDGYNGQYIVDRDGLQGVVSKDDKTLLDFTYQNIATTGVGSYLSKYELTNYIANDGKDNITLFDSGCKKVNDETYTAFNGLNYFDQNNLGHVETGYMAFTKEGKTGIIDHKGKTIIPFEYDAIENKIPGRNITYHHKYEAFELSMNGNTQIVNKDNKALLTLTPLDKEMASFRNEEDNFVFGDQDIEVYFDGKKTHYFDKDLKETLVLDGEGSVFRNGIATIRSDNEDGSSRGSSIIDEKGNEILSTIKPNKNKEVYNSLSTSNGFILYSKINQETQKREVGILNKDLKVLVKNETSADTTERTEMSAKKCGDKVILIQSIDKENALTKNTIFDETGKQLATIEGEISRFSHPQMIANSIEFFEGYSKPNTKSHYVTRIDKNGKENAYINGVIDASGKVIIEPIYRSIRAYDDYIVVVGANNSSLLDKKTYKEVMKSEDNVALDRYSN